MTKPTPARTFLATLERGDRALGWTIAQVPFKPAEVWPHMLRLRVRGEVNGFPFRTSLFPNAQGGFYLLVNCTMQQGAQVRLGEKAEFVLQPDLASRPADLPDSLAVLLEEEPGLREWYDELSEYTRREIGKWCEGVKSEETKLHRAEQMAERLLSTMEAERELPPFLVRAFHLRPKAKAGWERMTPAQRRAELMGVFYYRTVEARDRRVAKLCDVAETKAIQSLEA